MPGLDLGTLYIRIQTHTILTITMRKVLLLPLYRWGTGRTGGPRNLPEVTQPVNAELGTKF